MKPQSAARMSADGLRSVQRGCAAREREHPETVTAPPKPDEGVESTPDSETQIDPPYNVVIHNNDRTNSV